MRDFKSVQTKELMINEIENARKSLNIAFLLAKNKKIKSDLLQLCDLTDDLLSLTLDTK